MEHTRAVGRQAVGAASEAAVEAGHARPEGGAEPADPLLEQLGAAVVADDLPRGERLLAAAPEQGAPWHGVVIAWAEAMARRPRWGASPAQRPEPRATGRLWWAALPLLGWAAAGMGLLEAGYAVGAVLLGALAAIGPWAAEAAWFADPIYTRAAFETLGYLQPVGLAVGERWPLEVAMAPGAGALASALAATLANVLAIGLALRLGGARGLALQAVVAGHLALVPPRPHDLEASGVSFALGVLAPDLTGRRVAVSDLIVGWPFAAQTAVLVALGLGVAYAGGWVVAGLASFLASGGTAWQRALGGWLNRRSAVARGPLARTPEARDKPPRYGAVESAQSRGVAIRGRGAVAGRPGGGVWAAAPTGDTRLASLARSSAVALAAVALAALATLATGSAPSRSGGLVAELSGTAWRGEASAAADLGVPGRAEVAGVVAPVRRPLGGPSHVQAIMHSLDDYHFEYRVNGRREVLRGMGYNVRYAHLPPPERARRFDRDFAVMAAVGVNTVLGWESRLFDRVLLDAADAHGLGVILPFELDPKADYADPATRARITAAVEDWVRRYRDHPALRMWGVGNEVLHKMIRPTWLGGMHDAPETQARARAFSEFLLDLAERVWELDPRHPFTYRTAEYGYLVWLREQLEKRGGMPENMVLGSNVYTAAMREVVEKWPELYMTVPVYISEFGAAGLAPGERPAALRRMWTLIRSRPNWVFGGAVYVWTTDGPEEVDRTFGLVDANGVPVDGSLATLAELFRGEESVSRR